jgi:hypothetical protein
VRIHLFLLFAVPAWMIGSCVLPGTTVRAQQVRARIPSNTAPLTDPAPMGGAYGTTAPNTLSNPYGASPVMGGSATNLTPLGTGGNSLAGVSLGQPVFDPYAASPGFQTQAPSIFGGPAPPPTTPPGFIGEPPLYAPPPSQTPSFGGGGFQSSPPALFPNGFSSQGGFVGGSGTFAGAPVQLISGPRIRHGWLTGGDGLDLQSHDTDLSLVLTYPNFLFSNQPLYVAPSFSLHLWDGPDSSGAAPPDPQPDLPSRAYSAFLDTLWRSDPNLFFGGEAGVRLGIFSDFDTMNSDSVRIMGQGLLRLRVTPTVTARGGVIYVNRNRIKLIPAGGILWQPNPQTRFDIYFPQPKLAQYMTTLGNQDVWWYIAGEYGGGSWTVQRAVVDASERVDVNDIRVILGLEWGPQEWFREGRRLGFIEAAWVTEREIVYADRVGDDVSLRDTFMLRAGFGY